MSSEESCSHRYPALHSYQQAEKFHQEVPGIVIPEQVRVRLGQAGDVGSLVGITMAKEMIKTIAPFVQGMYLMPFDRFELVRELLPYTHLCVEPKARKETPFT